MLKYCPPIFHSAFLYDHSFFQIIEIFGFSIGYNYSEMFQQIVKKHKKSKFQNPQNSLVRTIGRKIQDKFETVVAICRRSGSLKVHKMWCFVTKIQKKKKKKKKKFERMAQKKQQLKLKEIQALGTEITKL